MCPLYPVHLVFTYGALILFTWLVAGSTVASALSNLAPRLVLSNTSELITTISIKEGEQQNISFYFDNIPNDYLGQLQIKVNSKDGFEHLDVYPSNFPVNKSITTSGKPPSFPIYNSSLPHTDQSFPSPLSRALVADDNDQSPKDDDGSSSSNDSVDYEAPESKGRYLEGQFSVSGELLGFSDIRFVLSNGDDAELMESVPVVAKVHRGKHVLDKIFVHVVVLLVVLIYFNMGCTIDIEVIKQTVRRPIAPVIGLLSQYLFMPACSYGLGYLLLSSTPSLWLGLFVTGCSPGGGGSNMWTYILGGSLDLSVTMTFFSTVAAFAFMPLWVWLLAPTIFSDGRFDSPPFRNIGYLTIGILVPVGGGLLLRRYCPKAADCLKKALKPICIVFIIFVMAFGTYAYWFIFRFFTWQVAVCGFCLPWLGFMAGLLASVASKRPRSEVIAISIETGLQNTGLAIGFLKIALSSFAPLGDIAMIVPVAVATFTPVPLLGWYLGGQCKMWWRRRKGFKNGELLDLGSTDTYVPKC